MSLLHTDDVTTAPTGFPGVAVVAVNGHPLTRSLVASLPVVDEHTARGVLDAGFRLVAQVHTGAAYAGPGGAPVIPRCELVAVQVTPHGDRLVRVVSARPVLIGAPAQPGHGRLTPSTRLPVAHLEEW